MYLVFDTGGTKTRMGLVSESFKLVASKTIKTPKKVLDGIQEMVKFADDKKIYGVAGAIAGILGKNKSILYKGPNIPGWEGVDLKKKFKKEFGCEAYFENDAAFAGVGEAVYGAGRGLSIASYLTISTGVGGARIVNGKIDENIFGFEPGAQYVRQENGKLITFEDTISGTSINKTYNKKGEEIDSKRVWKEIIKNVAIGLNNVAMFWSPDIIVLGGGVSLSEYFDLKTLRDEMEKLNVKFPKLPILRKAKLGDFSGIYGGIAYLKKSV